MTETTHTSWPNIPGVPLNSDQNGAHQLTHAAADYPCAGPWVLLWCSPESLWTDLFGNRVPPEAVAMHRYIGPMTPPSEVHLAGTTAAAEITRLKKIEAAAEALLAYGWVPNDEAELDEHDDLMMALHKAVNPEAVTNAR